MKAPIKYGLKRGYGGPEIIHITKVGHYYYGRTESGRNTSGRTRDLLAVHDTEASVVAAAKRVAAIVDHDSAQYKALAAAHKASLEADMAYSAAIEQAAKPEAVS